MANKTSIVAVYDFELFPYALGDVLTWNIQTAIRCEELNREFVDVYVCLDKRYPASIYQRGLITSENCEMFFSELFGAFGTHPRLGTLQIFRCRDEMIEQLLERAQTDTINAEAINDYMGVLRYQVKDALYNQIHRKVVKSLKQNPFIRRIFRKQPLNPLVESNRNLDETVLNDYFIKYIHLHERINAFSAKTGSIPLLQPALGCEPDIDELCAKRFSEKKIVTFHLRLRRLDAGYGGDHSYPRDSDFLEWYEFLKEAGEKYPEIEFVALGRLQEKPVELLRLPNVTSLRVFGMGLGHELTLMLRSDLFIGTSSGFAAMANFSAIPYFITKMTPESCHAYAIPQGAERLPFAHENQVLTYEKETQEMLMKLLEKGLALTMDSGDKLAQESGADITGVDVSRWLSERSPAQNSAATTCRFYLGNGYSENETAFLLLPRIDEAKNLWLSGAHAEAFALLNRLENAFPSLCKIFPDYLGWRATASLRLGDQDTFKACLCGLEALAGNDKAVSITNLLKPYLSYCESYDIKDQERPNMIGQLDVRLDEILKELRP